jgi:hypothetical protein
VWLFEHALVAARCRIDFQTSGYDLSPTHFGIYEEGFERWAWLNE